MGFSRFQAPGKGILCMILASFPLTISIFRGFFLCSISILGIIRSPSTSSSDDQTPEDSVSETYISEFRDMVQALRFDTVCSTCCKQLENDEDECSVCLTRFEADSGVYCLSCGHLFHEICLEKWLRYLNSTCPLCRTPVMPDPQEEQT